MRPIRHRRWFDAHLDRALVSHLVVALCLCLAIVSAVLPILGGLVGDLRFKLVQRAASGDVVVVAIDPQSIRYVGAWPWPRSVYATLIDEFNKAGAVDIALDVDFSSPSVPAEDQAMASALARSNVPVILPVLQQPTGTGAIVPNVPITELATHAWLGSVNIIPDRDGRIRRYPMVQTIGDKTYPSFARQLTGGGAESGVFHIDFGIRADTIPIVSAADVLAGLTDRATLAGRHVIIGGTALELGDRHAVPPGQIYAGPSGASG